MTITNSPRSVEGHARQPVTPVSRKLGGERHITASAGKRSGTAGVESCRGETRFEILTDALRAAGRRGHRSTNRRWSFDRCQPNEVSARGRASTRSVAARAVKYPARRGASHRASFECQCERAIDIAAHWMGPTRGGCERYELRASRLAARRSAVAAATLETCGSSVDCRRTIIAVTKWRGPFPQGEPVEADGTCWDRLPPAPTARAA